jgi:hypothetical protein
LVHVGYISVQAGYILVHVDYTLVHAEYIFVHVGYILVHVGYNLLFSPKFKYLFLCNRHSIVVPIFQVKRVRFVCNLVSIVGFSCQDNYAINTDTVWLM